MTPPPPSGRLFSTYFPFLYTATKIFWCGRTLICTEWVSIWKGPRKKPWLIIDIFRYYLLVLPSVCWKIPLKRLKIDDPYCKINYFCATFSLHHNRYRGILKIALSLIKLPPLTKISFKNKTNVLYCMSLESLIFFAGSFMK